MSLGTITSLTFYHPWKCSTCGLNVPALRPHGAFEGCNFPSADWSQPQPTSESEDTINERKRCIDVIRSMIRDMEDGSADGGNRELGEIYTLKRAVEKLIG